VPSAIVAATTAPVGTGSTAAPVVLGPDLWVPEFSPPRRSESISKLALALSKAQGLIKGAAKSAENPHFKSKYSPLIEVHNAAREPLAQNELAVVQPVAAYGRFVCITTILVHSSGEFIEQDLVMTAGNPQPQNVVGAVTYGRRAAYAAMVGVAPDEDDDGQSASETFPDGVKRDRGRRSELQASGGKQQAPEPAQPVQPIQPLPAAPSGPAGPKPGDPPNLEREPEKPNATPPGSPVPAPAGATPIAVAAAPSVPVPVPVVAAGSVPPPPGMKPPMRAPGS
jgi:hypothetical protein